MSLTTSGFLFGAGASVLVGLPTVGRLGQLVADKLTAQERYALEAVVERLSAIPGSVFSIERVVHLIETLLASQLPLPGLSLRNLSMLQYSIKKCIWQILTYDGELSKLDDFAQFVSARNGLDVFSLNNDMVLENWSARLGRKLFAGFDENRRWFPEGYKTAASSLRLYKLHGSVDWIYQPGRSMQRVRIDQTTRNPAGTYVLRTPLADLSMVFPSLNKVISNGPLLTLHHIFREKLKNLSLLIVVGCSLGDEHIRRAVFDTLASTDTFRVVIVGPDAFDVVGRLLPRKSPENFCRRVDALPSTFEEALESSLPDFVRRSKQGKRSPVSRTLRAIAEPPIRRGNQKWSELKEMFSGPRLPSGRDRATLALGIKWLFPPNLHGPKVDLCAEVASLLGAATGPDFRRKVIEVVDRNQSKFFDSCFGIDARGSVLYVLGGQPQKLCVVKPDWAYAQVGPRLHDSFGLAVRGDRAFVIERSRLSIEGLGSIREIDLGTGLSRCVYPRNKDAVNGLRILRRHGRKITSQEARDAGFLSYPTSVRIIDSSTLLVVESRRVLVIDTSSGALLRVTDEPLMNLSDIVLVDAGNAILLEIGAAGFGRLLWLSLSDMKTHTILENVREVQGLGIDRAKAYLLMTRSGERPNGAIDFFLLDHAERGLVSSTFRRIVTGLHVPRYLCQSDGERWYCSSPDGPLVFSV